MFSKRLTVSQVPLCLCRTCFTNRSTGRFLESYYSFPNSDSPPPSDRNFADFNRARIEFAELPAKLHHPINTRAQLCLDFDSSSRLVVEPPNPTRLAATSNPSSLTAASWNQLPRARGFDRRGRTLSWRRRSTTTGGTSTGSRRATTSCPSSWSSSASSPTGSPDALSPTRSTKSSTKSGSSTSTPPSSTVPPPPRSPSLLLHHHRRRPLRCVVLLLKE